MALPDYEFIDGFDKYGPVGTVYSTTVPQVMAGEWTGMAAPNGGTPSISVLDGLAGIGRRLRFNMSSGFAGSPFGTFRKTLPSNFARIIGGGCFLFPSLPGANMYAGIANFVDATTDQVCVSLNPSGQIEVRRGNPVGTLLGSGGALSAATEYYI